MEKKKLSIVASTALAVLMLGGCYSDQESEVNKKASSAEGYIPQNDVEINNFNRAQELYDNPAAIQWCTAFPSSNSAPIITIPIAGKLTTSSSSFFDPTTSDGTSSRPARSVDGMYHGDSFYRYGFTPGGQYVDFSNSLELLCTTHLTEFQRQNTYVEGVGADGDASSVDVDSRQKSAEEALKNGETEKAVDLLEGR